MKNLFLLDKEITFLNFGSFGACPKEIFDDYINWQYLLEKEPVQYITVDGYDYLKKSSYCSIYKVFTYPQFEKFNTADFEIFIGKLK